MTSIALGIVIVFIIYVMVWSIKNDGARSIGEQTGIIKMRESAKETPKPGISPVPRAASAPPDQNRSGSGRARRPLTTLPPKDN